MKNKLKKKQDLTDEDQRNITIKHRRMIIPILDFTLLKEHCLLLKVYNHFTICWQSTAKHWLYIHGCCNTIKNPTYQ